MSDTTYIEGLDRELKPTEFVLVKYSSEGRWMLDIFVAYVESGGLDKVKKPMCMICTEPYECVPFEGNKHLLLTKHSPAKELISDLEFGEPLECYDTEKREWVDAVFVCYDNGSPHTPYTALRKGSVHIELFPCVRRKD